MSPTLRLESPGLEPLELDHRHGWVLDPPDLGSPDIREVEFLVPGGDGVTDTSQFVGARDVIVTGTMFAAESELWEMKDRLAAFTSPKRRCHIFIREHSSQPERMLMTARGLRFPRRIVDRDHDGFLAAWRTPNGVLESTALNTETILPGAEEGAPGIEFDVEFDPTVEFPAVAAPGAGEVANAGNFDAYPVLRLFGPFGDEGNAADETVVGNLTTGRTLTFAGTAIAAGDYLEIDTRAKTIRVNGLAAQSRQDRLVFPDSQWFTLVPGVNEVAFRPDTFSGNAQCLVLWRDSWL